MVWAATDSRAANQVHDINNGNMFRWVESAVASADRPARAAPSARYSRSLITPGLATFIRPSLFAMSTGFTAAAASTAIRTCPGPGSGAGTSASSSASGPP
jgi:hypothetical protein